MDLYIQANETDYQLIVGAKPDEPEADADVSTPAPYGEPACVQVAGAYFIAHLGEAEVDAEITDVHIVDVETGKVETKTGIAVVDADDTETGDDGDDDDEDGDGEDEDEEDEDEGEDTPVSAGRGHAA